MNKDFHPLTQDDMDGEPRVGAAWFLEHESKGVLLRIETLKVRPDGLREIEMTEFRPVAKDHFLLVAEPPPPK